MLKSDPEYELKETTANLVHFAVKTSLLAFSSHSSDLGETKIGT
jgi:hypothetical protein